MFPWETDIQRRSVESREIGPRGLGFGFSLSWFKELSGVMNRKICLAKGRGHWTLILHLQLLSMAAHGVESSQAPLTFCLREAAQEVEEWQF